MDIPLRDLLSAKGLKSTREREVILRELDRTLKLLEKLHCVEKLDIKKNCFYYGPLSQNKYHGHLICDRCGKIIDFSSSGLEILKAEVCKDNDFKLDNISIQVFGLCRDCQRASKNMRSL